MNVFPVILACHLIGDFLLQNHWMQRKSQSSAVCLVHVAMYCSPFLGLVANGSLPWWAFWAIAIEHFLQDRFALHLKWMRAYGHTTPDKWPMGPLCVDQAMHVAFLAILTH